MKKIVSVLLMAFAACSTGIKQPVEGWSLIGPGGGGSTFIPCFSYHTANDFLIRCDMTGAYLTRDGGQSYDIVNFQNGSSCFAYDPHEPNTVYIGSTFLNRSVDGGKTWNTILPKPSEISNERFSGDHAGYSADIAESSLYPQDARRVSMVLVDPVMPGTLYVAMGAYLLCSSDAGKTWTREKFEQRIDYMYTNRSDLKNELYIFTSSSILIFDKTKHKFTERKLPVSMTPAESFTAGTLKNSDKMVFYALHHTVPKANTYAFTTSELWLSYDAGMTWSPVNDPVITSQVSGVKPCFTMVRCSEMDAAQAYVVTNKYQEPVDGKTVYWYGAIKTGDSGQTWDWALKGGGGSGQYGVQDAQDAKNLKDAWVHEAFGGEFIQLMDVGVSPIDGNIAAVTDWYRTMKTINGGDSWEEVYSIANGDGTYTSRGMDVTTTYGVHFDPFDKRHIAISYTDIGYHHSYDGGKSWTRSVTGVPNRWVNTCYWVVFDPDVNGKVWSVWANQHDYPRGKMTRDPQWSKRGVGGVCTSGDGGKTWTPSIEGMGANSPATCIVLDPKSKPGNRTLYVSVYNKGVFKSTDDGKTWNLKNKGIEGNTCAFELTLAQNGVLFLVVSPTPMHKNGERGDEFYSGEVYRSTDGAETWTRLKVTDGLLFPNGVDIDPRNPKRIYLACWANITLGDLIGGSGSPGARRLDMPGGIFRSEDGGDTWTSIFDDQQYIYDVTVDPYHKGRLYCGTFNQAAYRSDDDGLTWKKLKGYDFHWGHRVVIDANDHEKVYITTFGSSVWHGYPIIEEGETGTQKPEEWSHIGIGGGGAMFNPSVSPHDPKMVFVGCDMGGCYVTYNGGESWRMFNLGGRVRYFVYDPVDPNVVYANSFGSFFSSPWLYKSDDKGLTWHLFYPKASEVVAKVSKGDHGSEVMFLKDSTSHEVQAIAVDPVESNSLYAVISIEQSVAFYTSTDGGMEWKKEKEFDNDIKNIFIDPSSPVHQRTLYFTWSNGVYQRVNGQWYSFGTPDENVKFNFFSGGYDANAKKFILYAISGRSYFNRDETLSGIFYSDDGGRSWENRQDGLLNFCLPDRKKAEFRGLATCATDPGTLYVSYNGLATHADTTCHGVAKSVDFGKTWTLPWRDKRDSEGVGIPMSNYSGCWLNENFGSNWGENPFSLAVYATDANVCYGTDFGRTIKTENGGKTWEAVYSKQLPDGSWTTRGLDVTSCYSVAVDPFDEDHLFITLTDIGMMESHNGGKGWTSATTQNNGVPRHWRGNAFWLTFDPEVKDRIWVAMSREHDFPRAKMFGRVSLDRCQGGILLSNDGATTWQQVSSSIGEAAMVHILLDPESNKDARTLYACAFGKGVFKSTDGGLSWVQKNNGLEGDEPLAFRIERRKTDGALFLIATRRSEDGSIGNEWDGALYKSTDGADTWTKMTLPEGCNGPTDIVTSKKYPQRLVLSAWGRATAPTDLFARTVSMPFRNVLASLDKSTPGRFEAEAGGGIFISDDEGKTWTQVMGNGVPPSQFADQHIYGVSFDDRNGRYYACGFNASAYYSEDGAKTWNRIRGFNFKWGHRVIPDPRNPEMIFITTFGGGVWYGPAKGDPEATEDVLTHFAIR